MKVSGRGPKVESAYSGSASARGVDPASSRPGLTKEGLKSADAIRAEGQAWADAQVMTSSCTFCDWTHEGPAVECRAKALKHRQKKHPEACVLRPRMRRRISKRKNRTASEEAQIAVDTEEANRLRRERDEAQVLAKIERGRERDRAALTALDQAVV